jgi:small subunit ribosomal protein S13
LNYKPDSDEKVNEDSPNNSEEKVSDEPQQEKVDIPEESEIEKNDTQEPEENIEKDEDISEDKKESKPEEKPVEIKEKKEKAKSPEKAEDKKGKPKKKDRGPDFKYIVRLSNTDIDGEKNVVYGLSSIKGIGIHMANLIAEISGIDKNIKFGDLKDDQIEKLQGIIDNINNNAPGWMLNHRKNYETGEDIHLVSSEIDMQLRDEINIMKKIRSYRGIRHERGLPVRGQRTRANNRKGLALGVSKKREPSTK